MAHTLTVDAPRYAEAPSFFSKVAEFFEIVGAARRLASAIEARRAPAAADLKILGIDNQEGFATIIRR